MSTKNEGAGARPLLADEGSAATASAWGRLKNRFTSQTSPSASAPVSTANGGADSAAMEETRRWATTWGAARDGARIMLTRSQQYAL